MLCTHLLLPPWWSHPTNALFSLFWIFSLSLCFSCHNILQHSKLSHNKPVLSWYFPPSDSSILFIFIFILFILQCWPSQNNDLHFFKFHLPTSHPHLRDFSSDLIPEFHKLNSSGLLYTFHWMSSNSVYYKLKSTPFTWDPSCFYLRNSLKFQDQ